MRFPKEIKFKGTLMLQNTPELIGEIHSLCTKSKYIEEFDLRIEKDNLYLKITAEIGEEEYTDITMVYPLVMVESIDQLIQMADVAEILFETAIATLKYKISPYGEHTESVEEVET